MWKPIYFEVADNPITLTLPIDCGTILPRAVGFRYSGIARHRGYSRTFAQAECAGWPEWNSQAMVGSRSGNGKAWALRGNTIFLAVSVVHDSGFPARNIANRKGQLVVRI